MSFTRPGIYGMTALALLALSAGAFGATLTAIDPLEAGTSTDAKGVTISPSGQAIVVGVSSPPVAQSFGGFIWDPTNGARSVLSSENAALTKPLGVGYRTVNGQPQLVINGEANGWNADFFSNDDGLTWTKIRRDLFWPSDKSGPLFVEQNSLGISLNSSVYYTIARKSGTEIFSLKHDSTDGDPPAVLVSRDVKSTSEEAAVRAASASGLSVGSRKNGQGQERIYVYQHRGIGVLPNNGTQSVAFLNGLAGNELGQAWAVSQDGTKVFGMSPVSDGRSGNWPFMMTVSVTPKVGDPTDFDIVRTGIQELPTYPDTTGSTTNAVPYGVSEDGTFAAGMNYRGQERAVLWDLRDSNPANWKIYDLTAYFGALGQATQTNALGPFTRLTRAKAVAVDDTKVVVVGIGATAAGTRAFVATIPLSEFPLPDTGACCMIGSCTSKFAADCPNIEGQQSWTANTLCINASCPGACCHADGTCSDFVAADACVGEGDIARGASTSCATACLGACCNGQNTCVQENYGVCPEADFKGIGTDCANEACPCSSTYHVWADRDMDGDVDQEDFGMFQACITGVAPGVAPECECFDHVNPGNGVIDEFDLNAFEDCATGPAVVGVNPNCDL
ncbi:MAG TPA: hypothetical protein PK184_15105 [Phycisphaerae bacterium]|nr:hypothetical protein [Phycisphaerae bacterium]